jgi:hypothetical protein
MTTPGWPRRLTPIERDVLLALAAGSEKVSEIAAGLNTDERLVRMVVDRLLYELRLATLADLAAYVRLHAVPP